MDDKIKDISDLQSVSESAKPDSQTHAKKIESNLNKKLQQKAGNEFQQAAYLDALEEIANSNSHYASVVKTIY